MLKCFQSFWVIIGVAAFAVSARASSLSVLDLVTSGDPHAVTVAQGTPFTVKLQLSEEQPFIGYSIFLKDVGYTNTTRFTISNRTSLPTNPFTDATTADSTFLSDPIKNSTHDLGYTANTGMQAASATYDLMSLVITPAVTLTPSTYTISFNLNTGLTLPGPADGSFDTMSSYTVYVVGAPEPSTVTIVALAGFAAFCRRRHPRNVGVKNA